MTTLSFDPDAHAGDWAKRVIRAEMAKRGINYRELGDLLERVGAYEDDERVLRNKVARATFSAGFFIQCLAAMDCRTLEIDYISAYRESQFVEEKRNRGR